MLDVGAAQYFYAVDVGHEGVIGGHVDRDRLVALHAEVL